MNFTVTSVDKRGNTRSFEYNSILEASKAFEMAKNSPNNSFVQLSDGEELLRGFSRGCK